MTTIDEDASVARPPRILLLGTDWYVSTACVRLGVDAVMICGPGDWDRENHLPDGVRVLRVDDPNHPEDILMALARAGLGVGDFDAVQTTEEFCLVTAGVVGAHLGARAIAPDVAVHLRDKFLQKQRIRAAGIAVTRSVLVEDVRAVDAQEVMIFERAVLKPLAGAGTMRTSAVGSASELEAISRDLAEQGVEQRAFVLEEFVPGDEWIVDGVVSGGELRFFSLSRYCSPLLTVLDESLPLWIRHFDPDVDAWAYALAGPMAADAVAALGLTDGVFHMELFHDAASGTLTFSECAGRRGGALIQEEVLLKFGVDLAEAALLCALGRDPGLDVRVRPGVVGDVYLPSRPGVVVAVPRAEELEALDDVVYARIEVLVGAVMPREVTHTSQRLGQLLVLADSDEAFERRAAELRAWFDARLVVAPLGASRRELRAWQRAFLPEPETRNAYSPM